MTSQEAKVSAEKQTGVEKTIADDDVSIAQAKSVIAGEVVGLDAPEVFLR